MIQGVHFVTPDQDAGWKAIARNVSDLAAMGGRPLHALVSLVIPPGVDVTGLLDGLTQATELCPVVGGDTASGPTLIVTVAVTGTVDGEPVLRSGARPGDVLFVTGPLGGAPTRPIPRVAEGTAARVGGATAMIDISDGLSLDLRRLADDSGVGVALDAVPIVDGVALEEALTWGDDYELVFAAPDVDAVVAAFAAAGLPAPIEIGRCTATKDERRLGDGPLPEGGWEHTW
ncbi:MAG: thiamine-monophosphate kinase [Actinomycetia bacterium]|nr:thiamine-monophosphate kinase [Actinomycetes bacterium]